ncbi:LuxR family maltose regulon positive regulatory protein [Saccharomonospora amisosensis]|uniref:LuxR family maltose regulon positive regulatory protein n=1 Tax=Saccharomonospora amisosensis TaxID=1128677 RepID=A0A7X5US09_9PSEU|nr:LuxR C-terminal-related transcriptional regulator [Saccharomonospora amisosensis]NIJ13141.1 LuxR family maltose regulon positive regulatory protein [Saccharomonospora amisosensis]
MSVEISQSSPVLAAKFACPTAPSGQVRRQRLERLLDAASPVTVVCAPPGFGKTTLLAEWARQRAGEVAWISVDGGDNRPGALRRAVLAALGVDEQHGRSGGQAGAGGGLVPWPRGPRGITEQTGEVTGHTRSFLVLDDAHLLSEQDAWRELESLLLAAPDGPRLLLSTRRRPALPLHRLRVAGRLRELGHRELALSECETAAVLAEHDVRLTDADLTRLMRRTEGWPAAVRMAALALADSSQHTATIDALAEYDRAVADYLAQEVLAELPAEQLDVLLRTSVCERFTVELAGRLADRDDAGDLLDRIERTTQLLTRDDSVGGWLRCHPLLRGHLRATLRSRSIACVAPLHRAAATWFAGHGEPLTAMRHAAEAADEELLAELVVRHGPTLLLRGGGGALRQRAATLPQPVTQRADVDLVLTMADLAGGDRRGAQARLARLAEGEALSRDRQTYALALVALAHHCRLTGRLTSHVEALDSQLDHITSPDLRTLALVNRGTARLWFDCHRQAADDLEHTLRQARERGYHQLELHCLAHLAATAAAAADYPAMRDWADEACGFARAHDLTGTAADSLGHAMAAWGAHQELDDDAARAHAESAARLTGRGHDRMLDLTVRSIVAIVAATTDPQPALAGLRTCWNAVESAETPQRTLVARAATAEHRMALRLGRPDWAAEAHRRATAHLGDVGEIALMRARNHAHHGRVTAARSHVDRLLRDGTFLLLDSDIEAHLLAASLADRAGDSHLARQRLSSALELAAPSRALRPFHEAGSRVRDLLAAQAGRFGVLEPFVGEVLSGFTPARQEVAVELTPRELALLTELPSMGTVEEIAANLYVSANTVKTHLRNIYRKLGVTTRRQAVQVARRTGLL